MWDNGIGIPPENREGLFQPFFTTKPTGEATGLALSISYEMVTQQRGVPSPSIAKSATSPSSLCGCRAGGIWLRERWVNRGMC